MKMQLPTMQQGEVEIRVPLCDAAEIVRGVRHLDLSLISAADLEIGIVLARIRTALQSSHTQLRGGRHVETNADAMRYLLESIHAASRPKR